MGYTELIQMAVAMIGEAKAQQLSEQQLAMLGKQLAELQGIELPELEQMKAEELGESAVGGLESDAGLKGKQLAAIAELQNIIDSGGLDFSDKVSLEEALNASRNQAKRARAGVAADAARRGGLNSGTRIMMDLDAASRGSEDLRKTGMQTAAMAQQRRLAAIKDASGMAGSLREQDWREKEASARARDLREERNAAAREKAAYYNAALPQQQFNNKVTKVTGQQNATNTMAATLGAAGQDARNLAAGVAGAVGAFPRAYEGQNSAGQLTSDSNYYADRGSASDLSRWDDEK